jgi:hypothetical protein
MAPRRVTFQRQQLNNEILHSKRPKKTIGKAEGGVRKTSRPLLLITCNTNQVHAREKTAN